MRTNAKLIKTLIILLILASCLSLSISLFAGSKKIEQTPSHPIEYSSAESNPTEEAERREKERLLDKVAERFKAETGFSGEITPNGALTHLGIYRGKFADIPFSADADTIAFRQACERILDKILPYTLAKRSQLSKSRIGVNSGRTSTEYPQVVNGYRVENRGMILITYDAGRYRFSISNGTVELPEEPLGEMITKEAAKQIALKAKDDKHYTDAEYLNTFYTNEGSDRYYLAYLVAIKNDNANMLEDILFWIDAKTGLIKQSRFPQFIN